MTQINRSADCGNSPKNTTTETLAVALETGDAALLEAVLVAAVVWRRPTTTLTGVDAVIALLASQPAPTKGSIDRVVSHGKVGAVNGVVQLGQTQRRFCHLLEFTSVKCERVARIETYQG